MSRSPDPAASSAVPFSPAPSESASRRLDKKPVSALVEEFLAHPLLSRNIAHALAGRNVVVVTPTASGKTMCYNVPVIQSILDDYKSGISVTNVQLQKVDPPATVIDAFRDVQAARADAERAINEATAYLNEVTNRAEGQAQQILQGAEAYKQERTAAADGDAQRFLSIYNEYVDAKDVTKRRIYLQTMEEILRNMDKVLIDGQNGSGVLPYLPLDKLTGDRERRDTTPRNPNIDEGLNGQ